MLLRIKAILASAVLLSLLQESIAASTNPAARLQQAPSNPERLKPVQIGSTKKKMSTTTETKKFFLAEILKTGADRAAALKSSLKKNQYVGSTASKSQGMNKTTNTDKILRLSSSDSIVASNSAPIPTLIKPNPRIQKPKALLNQNPKITMKKNVVNTNELKKTEGIPTSDMKASGSVLAGSIARQLRDPKSGYYQRPIYDYNDHGPYPISHDKTYDLNKDQDHYDSHDRQKFTNGHSFPAKSYGHEQSYEDGYVNAEGHQDTNDYGQTTGHVDDSYGHHENAAAQEGHSAGAEVIASHSDDHSYGGHSLGGAVGEGGHDKGEKGYVSKGHVDEGFDNVHHKVEYGYTETFGDDEGIKSYDSESDSGDSFYDLAEGGKYEEHDVKNKDLYDSYGEAGNRDRSDFEEKFESIKASLADELRFDDHDAFDGDHGSHDVYGGSYGSDLSFSEPHRSHDFNGNINAYDVHRSYAYPQGNQRRASGISEFPHFGVFDSIERGFKTGLLPSPDSAFTSRSSQHTTRASDFGGDSRPGYVGIQRVQNPLFREDIG